MEYTYLCKTCGYENKLEEKDLIAGGELICQRCLRQAGFSDTKPAPKRHSPARNGRGVALSEEQARAAYYRGDSSAVLVSGGAGSGRTKVLIERALYLIREIHVPPSNIAILTSTFDAAGKIAHCLEEKGIRTFHLLRQPNHSRWSMISDSQGLVFVSTFYSMCLDMQDCYCEYECVTHGPRKGWLLAKHSSDGLAFGERTLIDREDQCAIIRKLRNGLGLPAKTLSALVPEAEELRGIFSYISNSMIGVEDFYRRRPPAHAETIGHVKKLAEMYDRYKTENNEFDVDDILTLMASYLKKNSVFYSAVLPNKYLHVLIDDIQELTPVEWEILRFICPPSFLFCTGNDAQGICSSYGAGLNTVREFGKAFPGSVTFRLTENFRSTPEIADLSNELLKGAEPAYETTSTSHGKPSGCRPELHTFQSEQEEADFVLGSVLDKIGKGVPPGEITLLFRTADQAQVMERTLRMAGLPYRFLGGPSFTQKPHVRDFLSVIHALNDIYNEPAWCRFLSLYPGLEKTCSSLVRNMRKKLEAKDKDEDERSYLPENARWWLSDRLSAGYPQQSAVQGLAYFLKWPPHSFDMSEYMTEIMKQLTQAGVLRGKYDKWTERKKDLQLLIKIAEEDIYSDYENQKQFASEFKIDPDTIIMAHDPDAAKKLTLATVHSARHIESRYCYLFRVQDGVYPLGKASSPEEIEEERRVLYVAMTRARRQLIITQTAGRPSIFLSQAMKQKMDAGQSERNDKNG